MKVNEKLSTSSWDHKKQSSNNNKDPNNNVGINFMYQKWETKVEREQRMNEIMNMIREKKKDTGKEVDEEMLQEILLSQKRNLYQYSNKKVNGANDNNDNDGNDHYESSYYQLPIHWHDSFDTVPFQIKTTATNKGTTTISSSSSSTTQATTNHTKSIPTFIICQEFFDALPVHVFQKTEDGWRERLVDVAIEEEQDDNDNNTNDRVQVKMMDGTTASVMAPSSSSLDDDYTTTTTTTTTTSSSSKEKKKPRFRFVLSPDITPALRSLLHIDSNGKAPPELENAPFGTIVEISPESLALVQDLALRIEECQGAALIVDYGNEGSKDTLRAFRKHEQVHVLSSPGTVDITADVDFSAMKNAVNVDLMRTKSNSNNDVVFETEAFGPKTQGEFLSSMGAVERTINLIEDDNTTDEQAEDLCIALERLVSVEEMGERFKVLAIARKKDGIFPPPGF